MPSLITSASILLALLIPWAASAQGDERSLRAGAYVQDVTGSFDSYLVSGGFTERRRGKMNPGDLNARCFVLQRGKVTLAIAVVDSCMIPRTVCDEAKKLASKTTGIPLGPGPGARLYPLPPLDHQAGPHAVRPFWDQDCPGHDAPGLYEPELRWAFRPGRR